MSSTKRDEILGRSYEPPAQRKSLAPFRRSASLLFRSATSAPPPSYDAVVKDGNRPTISRPIPIQQRSTSKFAPSLDTPPKHWEARALKDCNTVEFVNSYSPQPRYRKDGVNLTLNISKIGARHRRLVPEKEGSKVKRPEKLQLQLDALKALRPALKTPDKIHPAFRTPDRVGLPWKSPSPPTVFVAELEGDTPVTPVNDYPSFNTPDYQKAYTAELEAPLSWSPSRGSLSPHSTSHSASPPTPWPSLRSRRSVESSSSSQYSPITPQWIPDYEKIVITQDELREMERRAGGASSSGPTPTSATSTFASSFPSPTSAELLKISGLEVKMPPPRSRKRKVYDVRFVGETVTNQMEILKNGIVVMFVEIKCSFFGTPMVCVHSGAGQDSPIVAACKSKQIRSGFYTRVGDIEEVPYQKWPRVRWNSWNEKDYLFEFEHRHLSWRSNGEGLLDFRHNAGDHHLIDLDTGVVLAAYHKDRTWFAFKPFAKVEFYVGVGEELEVLSLAIIMAIEERRRRAIEANAAGYRGG